jgi:hypothetical protein
MVDARWQKRKKIENQQWQFCQKTAQISITDSILCPSGTIVIAFRIPASGLF